MKRSKGKIVLLIVLVVLPFLFFVGCDLYAARSDVGEKDDSESQLTEAELNAIYATEELMNVWETERPVFFGGAYREGEKCVVLLVEDKESYRSEVIEWSRFAELISFKKCTFSLNYLQTMYDEMTKLSDETYFRHHISVKNNCIIVNIAREEEKLEEKLLNIDTEGGGQAIQIQIETEENNLTDADA